MRFIRLVFAVPFLATAAVLLLISGVIMGRDRMNELTDELQKLIK